MLGAILTAPYLLQGSANRAASEMSHRSDHPRKSTCTQVSRNNGRIHGPTRKASNQASNETMKRKPSRTVQTVVYSKDARDRSFYQCKSWSLAPPKQHGFGGVCMPGRRGLWGLFIQGPRWNSTGHLHAVRHVANIMSRTCLSLYCFSTTDRGLSQIQAGKLLPPGTQSADRG